MTLDGASSLGGNIGANIWYQVRLPGLCLRVTLDGASSLDGNIRVNVWYWHQVRLLGDGPYCYGERNQSRLTLLAVSPVLFAFLSVPAMNPAPLYSHTTSLCLPNITFTHPKYLPHISTMVLLQPTFTFTFISFLAWYHNNNIIFAGIFPSRVMVERDRGLNLQDFWRCEPYLSISIRDIHTWNGISGMQAGISRYLLHV